MSRKCCDSELSDFSSGEILAELRRRDLMASRVKIRDISDRLRIAIDEKRWLEIERIARDLRVQIELADIQ